LHRESAAQLRGASRQHHVHNYSCASVATTVNQPKHPIALCTMGLLLRRQPKVHFARGQEIKLHFHATGSQALQCLNVSHCLPFPSHVPIRPLARVPERSKNDRSTQALQCLNVSHCLPFPSQIPSDPLPGFRMVEKRPFDPSLAVLKCEPLSPHSEPNPVRPLARVPNGRKTTIRSQALQC